MKRTADEAGKVLLRFGVLFKYLVSLCDDRQERLADHQERLADYQERLIDDWERPVTSRRDWKIWRTYFAARSVLVWWGQ